MTRDFWGVDKDPKRGGRGWGHHRDPRVLERKVLEVLARLHAIQSLTAREIQHQVFGTDKYGANATHAAIGRLHNRKAVKRSGAYGGGDGWKVTDVGRAELGWAEWEDSQPEGAA